MRLNEHVNVPIEQVDDTVALLYPFRALPGAGENVFDRPVDDHRSARRSASKSSGENTFYDQVWSCGQFQILQIHQQRHRSAERN
jgi:hypothetical protein